MLRLKKSIKLNREKMDFESKVSECAYYIAKSPKIDTIIKNEIFKRTCEDEYIIFNLFCKYIVNKFEKTENGLIDDFYKYIDTEYVCLIRCFLNDFFEELTFINNITLEDSENGYINIIQFEEKAIFEDIQDIIREIKNDYTIEWHIDVLTEKIGDKYKIKNKILIDKDTFNYLDICKEEV